jgi:hypothetical protein
MHLGDIWGSEGVSPLILNLTVRNRWVANLMPWLLYLQERLPGLRTGVDVGNVE